MLQRFVAGIADRKEEEAGALALQFEDLAGAEGLREGGETLENVGEVGSGRGRHRRREDGTARGEVTKDLEGGRALAFAAQPIGRGAEHAAEAPREEQRQDGGGAVGQAG